MVLTDIFLSNTTAILFITFKYSEFNFVVLLKSICLSAYMELITRHLLPIMNVYLKGQNMH